jgi:hypothetical protein
MMTDTKDQFDSMPIEKDDHVLFYDQSQDGGPDALGAYGLKGPSKIYFAKGLDPMPEAGYIRNPDKRRTTYIMRRTHLADRWCNKVCPRLRKINGFREAATTVVNINKQKKANEITIAGHRKVANETVSGFNTASNGHLANKFSAYRTKQEYKKEW